MPTCRSCNSFHSRIWKRLLPASGAESIGGEEKVEWTPESLFAMSGSFWQTCTLHAAVKLAVFDRLGKDKLTSTEMAERLQCDPRAVSTLLNALAAMGLVVKQGEIFANSDASGKFLVSQSPQYVGYMIMHHHHLVEAWSKLDRAVLGGGSVRPEREPTEIERESFLMGMFNMAMAIAPGLAKEIDLKGRESLLDLGGGPGTYAIHFCLENPRLRATVFDQGTTRPFAEKTVNRFGLSDRIAFASGNYLKDPIEGKFDVAWLSHVLHGEGPDGCRIIINKAASALAPGGLLMVHDFILEDTKDGPLFPALFSLNMLVNTKAGRSYSETEIGDMLREAGLSRLRRLPFKGPTESGIIAAEK
ncbi:MAG: methyltransferase domain-containing protein [Deltaproteobacteria bacterium]|nr:methyltransferase domain-containing protein [Deltaproteobacteria bacterium]